MTSAECYRVISALQESYLLAETDYKIALEDYGENHTITMIRKMIFDNVSDALEIMVKYQNEVFPDDT